MRSLSGWALGLALGGGLAVGGVLAGLGPPALAATVGHYAVPVLRLPFMTAPPLDGVVRPHQWRGADEMTGLGSGPDLAPWTVHFWVGADRRELFIAMVSATPPGGKLLARVNPMPPGVNAHPAMVDDTVEILVAPSPHRKGGRVYEAILNAKGAIWQAAFRKSGGSALAWQGHWRVANRIIDNRWHFEAAIPWRDFGIEDVRGRSIGIRVGRDWLQIPRQRWAQTQWSPLPGPYVDPATMPLVTFAPGAPVVQVRQLRDKAGRSADIRLTIRNPADTPRRVRYSIVVRSQSGKPTTESRTLTLPPRYTRIVEVRPTATPDERLYTQIRVDSPNDRTTFYRRAFQWTIARPQRLWALNEDAAKRIGTAFMYYPSLNALQVRVNLKGLADPGAVRAVALQVRDQRTGKVVADTVMPAVHQYVTRLREWRLPPLDGKYDLVVRLQGTHAKAQVLPFVRYRFPWEHNRLGRANLIVPPFTPIRVRGDTVSTVLRRYTMNGLGLWRQVDALGRDLLKAPMRIEVRAAGKTFIARGRMKFTRVTPTQVIAVARWAAGPLHGSTRSVWDYDGMMKTTLTLEPTRETLDWVGLVVPLVNKRMPLMHAVTDGLRFNYAGKTPAGLGEVWNGNQARRNDLIGSYVPYLWVGGPERGVAVFGDNDRGWVDYQAKKPCQELVRKADGTLEMRLNLVAKPARLTKPHRIVLGFQATPIKPMPKGWRRWTGLGVSGGRSLLFVGTGFAWGALSGSGDIYPRRHDFSIYRELARTRRTRIIPTGFIDRWLAGYRAPNPRFAKHYGPSVRALFTWIAQRPRAVVVYTNPAAMRVDTRVGRTYLNEWGEHLYPTRQYSYGEYLDGYVDPHRSFRDFALWYYDKMLTTFADGIYWDNMYLGDDFNTVLSDAYRLPDGRIQPAVALWTKRALVRRTAVLDRQLGKPDLNMVHMTNTAVAPVLAFARIDLDWEMHVGDKPFQERFSRAFILTESTGRQFGNVPCVLEDTSGHNPKKIAWARHTYNGVVLTFELAHCGGGGPELRRDLEDLVRFGYGTPRTRVWNYWRHGYPMRVTGDATSSIIVGKPGQAIIVVCDWGHGGTLRLHLDRRVLNLPGRLIVTDLETQRPVKVTAGGDILFHLKRYDYKMLLITVQGSTQHDRGRQQ